MEEIYKELENRLNYDVVFIIRKMVDKLNHKIHLDYCFDQLVSIKKEHIYLLRASSLYNYIRRPPTLLNKFILQNNNDKIQLNKETGFKPKYGAITN